MSPSDTTCQFSAESEPVIYGRHFESTILILQTRAILYTGGDLYDIGYNKIVMLQASI